MRGGGKGKEGTPSIHVLGAGKRNPLKKSSKRLEKGNKNLEPVGIKEIPAASQKGLSFTLLQRKEVGKKEDRRRRLLESEKKFHAAKNGSGGERKEGKRKGAFHNRVVDEKGN